MEKTKQEGIRVVTREEHLIMLRNSIMAKFINDEMDCSIWADELARMPEDDEGRKGVQSSFDATQGMMVKRQSAIAWLDEEIAKEKKSSKKGK